MSHIEEICKPYLGEHWQTELSRLECGINLRQIQRLHHGDSKLTPRRAAVIRNALQTYINTPDETMAIPAVMPTPWVESTELPGTMFRLRQEYGCILIDIKKPKKHK
jgi:hypothetical protein